MTRARRAGGGGVSGGSGDDAPDLPRLVVDLAAVQSLEHGDRGIARYAREHARALLHRGRVASLALSPALPFPRLLDLELLSSPLLRWNTRSTFRSVLDEAEGPLAYHVTSPFEISGLAEADLPPFALRPDLPLVVTLYDLIPLVLEERYLADPLVSRRYRVRAELLRSADLVLTISEHTRRDALEHLGLAPERVRTIGAGVSPWFRPAPSPEVPDAVLRAALPSLGPRFVLTVAGGDERKNTERLLAAWGALDPALREDLTLVVACQVDPFVRAAWMAAALGAGLGADDVLITGFVPDDVLRALYQRARLFVFPSLYEGFGLPAAEAMACGCPILTSSTSSLPEVLEWAPSTFDPTDVESMCRALTRGLADEGFRDELVERGAARRGAMTWEAVAERTESALASLPRWRPDAPLPLRIALVGPMPPQQTGIAEYNGRLVPELARRCELDVFSPAPHTATGAAGGVVRRLPVRALGRSVSPWAYDAVVYTVGNSDDHHDLYEAAQEHPGILWLHDVRLPGLYVTFARERVPPHAAKDFLRGRLLQQYRRRLPPGTGELDQEPVEYVDQGLGMTAELVQLARAVVVTSELGARLLALDAQPDALLPPLHVVPNAVPRLEPGVEVSIDGDEAVVASFGLVSPLKLSDLLVEAVALLPGVRLVFVGPVSDGDRERLGALAERLGAGERLTLTGAVERPVYDGWLRRADAGVQLRRSSNGESSAALLDCVAVGLPALTNAPTAGELPAGVVTMVPPAVEAEELASAIGDLLADRPAMAAMREAQQRHAAAWGVEQVAERVLEVVRSLPRA